MGFKETFLGDGERYNYVNMCIPQLPWRKTNAKLNFYTRGKGGNSFECWVSGDETFRLTTCRIACIDEPLPILLAALMGLQHCFAMVGGLITPPLVVFRFAICGFPFCPSLEQYAISASLLISGVATIINVAHTKIPFSDKFFSRPLFIGSGLLSVMGTSFTFLPIFEIAINQMKNEGIEGTVAYGKLLGTAMVCSFLSTGMSFLPINTIKNLFPPLVTAVTVMLIGIALTGTGMKVGLGTLTVQ